MNDILNVEVIKPVVQISMCGYENRNVLSKRSVSMTRDISLKTGALLSVDSQKLNLHVCLFWVWVFRRVCSARPLNLCSSTVMDHTSTPSWRLAVTCHRVWNRSSDRLINTGSAQYCQIPLKPIWIRQKRNFLIG